MSEIEKSELFLNDEDINIIEEIADKYNLTMQELGRMMSRKNGRYHRMQILFNSDEMNFIDRKTRELNISRSQYCRLCYRKALKEEIYKDIDILKVVGGSENNKQREYRAVISFDSSKDYLDVKKLAENLGVPVSSLMRYFALNINIDI